MGAAPPTPATGRICIATRDYLRPGETFVNRHVAHMWGGRTAVLCDRFSGENPAGVPVLARRGLAPSFTDRLAAPVMAPAMRMGHGSSRVPWGARARAIEAFLRDTGCRAILAEFGTTAMLYPGLAARTGLPLFTYFRGTDASAALRDPRVRRGYGRLFPRLAGVFAVSQALLDALAAAGFAHDNAHVIPSGVDTRRFAPGAKRPGSFLAVGRFVDKKAPLVTLDAFAQGTRGTNARLTFIGDGPLLAPARTRATALGIADRVSFPGALPHDAVRDALAGAEVFVQHSVTDAAGNTEGLPTSIQEAMASGCVTVSTRHAGIPEAIEHGATGWLVAEQDGAAMAARIREASHADLAAMGARARAVACARFDNDRLLAACEAVIARAL